MRSIRRMLRVVLVSVAAGAAVTCTTTDEGNLATGLDRFVRDYLTWYTIPGLAVVVVENGEVVFARGYGARNVDSADPVSPSTLFSTASVTKLFVGVAALQLAERGLLTLDAPVARYLPDFRLADPRYRDITVAQMLSHTSGLPDIEAEELYASWNAPEYDDGALERYVRSLRGETLIAAPGTETSYSNAAYEVLGDLIAKVSGRSLEAYVEQHILGPLGMASSTLLLARVDSTLLADPHLMASDLTYRVSDLMPYSRRHAASGTLFSSALDMSRFAIASMDRGVLDGVRILADSTYDLAWSPLGTPDNEFGASWLLEEFGPYRMYSHGGGDPGYRTEFYIIPELRAGVIVMANCWEDEINPVAMKALALLTGDDATDWFVRHRGELWQAVREDGAAGAVVTARRRIAEYGDSTFHPAILNQLGSKLLELDRAADAVELLRLNVELYPGIYQLHNSLARTYVVLGETQAAADAYRRALDLESDNAEAAAFLARVPERAP